MIPTILYRPGDNLHPENSHVIPALIRRIHEAKEPGAGEMVIWGSGQPMREFLRVEDMAAASVFVIKLDKETYLAHTQPNLSHINVGIGVDCTIRELAEAICRVVGYEGELTFDTSKPEGTPRKLLDVSRLSGPRW